MMHTDQYTAKMCCALIVTDSRDVCLALQQISTGLVAQLVCINEDHLEVSYAVRVYQRM